MHRRNPTVLDVLRPHLDVISVHRGDDAPLTSVAFLKEFSYPDLEYYDYFQHKWASIYVTRLEVEEWSVVSKELHSYVIQDLADKRMIDTNVDRALIIDNYLNCGGDPKTLRFLAIHDVKLDEFDRVLVKQRLEGTYMNWLLPARSEKGRFVETVRTSDNNRLFIDFINPNPFTTLVQLLLNEFPNKMGYAEIRRIITVVEDGQGSRNQQEMPIREPYNCLPVVHHIVELFRPGDEGFFFDRPIPTMDPAKMSRQIQSNSRHPLPELKPAAPK